jgi:tRNA-binding EMAP/Myf-like protein
MTGIATEKLANRVRIVSVTNLRAHPNADRLDILTLWDGMGEEVELVTGKHYHPGQLGVLIPVGAILPGPLAVDMWMWGAKPDKPWTVETKNMRGIMSAGLFSGREYRVDPNDPCSVERYAQNMNPADSYVDLASGWLKWGMWKDAWQLGDDVTEELGIQLPE